MTNEGVENELKIVNAYNNKCISSLTENQQGIINSIKWYDDRSLIIYASKINGYYKPDVEFDISKDEYRISIKIGTGNSVHQEKTESFISFCTDYLDMTEEEKNSLLMFLYGDGTIDGTGDIGNRLSAEEVKKLYAKEISVINDFFDRNKEELIDRFLVTGRLGRETGIIADYLYHGDENNGVICPLDETAVHIISQIKTAKEGNVNVGPFTVQTWKRNLNNKPDQESGRHSIQIKCSSRLPELIQYVENEWERIRPNILVKNDNRRIIGDNSHGFHNQEYIVQSINSKRFKDLNNNLRNMIKTMFPEVVNADIIYAEKIPNNKIKPQIVITVNGKRHLMSVKMGGGNSIHQEKAKTFLENCPDMSEELKKSFLLFLYGDGTTNGTGRIEDRMNESDTIKWLNSKMPLLQNYFDNHAKYFLDRFLVYGAYETVGAEYLYYGTERNGITVSYNDVKDYILQGHVSERGGLHIGPLSIQTWNRNLAGEKAKDFKRDSIQVKWSQLDFDLKEIMLLGLSNIGTGKGKITEYDLVSILNRTKNPNHLLWKPLCSTLGLSNLKNIYAVRVTKTVYSSISGQYVLPKSDIYLVEADLSYEFLLINNYWLDEDNMIEQKFKKVKYSGISCKNEDSSKFTFAKFTISSFNKLFNEPTIGAGISLFVNEKDVSLNHKMISSWGYDENTFKKDVEKQLELKLPNDFLTNVSASSLIKKKAIAFLKNKIMISKNLKNIIFKGIGAFEDPYCSEFLYEKGVIKKYSIPDFVITNGSGRHRGEITIILKPRQ